MVTWNLDSPYLKRGCPLEIKFFLLQKYFRYGLDITLHNLWFSWFAIFVFHDHHVHTTANFCGYLLPWRFINMATRFWTCLFLHFFSSIGQINFSHFERMNETERRGNGGATSKVDIEVEGAKTQKKVEKAVVLVMATNMLEKCPNVGKRRRVGRWE